MKRTGFVCSIFVCACSVVLAQAPAGQAAAGQPQPVQQVELSIPFGTVPGKLIAAGEYLIFVDDQQPQNSFVVPRGDIRSANYENGAMTLSVSRPIHDRSTLSFRFADAAGGQLIANWANLSSAPRTDQSSAPPDQAQTTGTTSAAAANQPGSMIFEVKHKHVIGSDNGRLIVTPTQVIYESVSDVNSSRQWNMSDIREVKRDNPYSLRITGFSGEDYRFDLVGQGMSNDQLKTLVDRVTLARVPRK